MPREAVKAPGCAPTPPFFSQAVKVGTMVFVSGQLSRDAQGNVVAKGDMAGQARQVILNIREILRAAGGDLRHVVKLTAFMTDMARAPEAWAVREEFFAAHPPASTGVEVSRLTHPDFLIEIEAIAVLED
ncbi:RidA family protein [Falsiroseomonas sp. HW251]|uniref:RidA family protein n=1 Tax=Falsiroseomonas sp. HW251 TaxID=3390998 RepID=UPI003D31F91F